MISNRGTQWICSSKSLFFTQFFYGWAPGLGDLEKMICPWKEKDAWKLEIQSVCGDLMSRIAAMCYLSETS